MGHDELTTRIRGRSRRLELHSLAANQALVDGNKRLALLATYVFRDLNGYELNTSQDAAYELVISVADGTLSDVEKIADRLAAWSG